MMPSRIDRARRAASARDASAIKRQRAALAVIVGAQQDQHVFGGDHDQQRPDDQRQNAEHDRLARRIAGPDGREHRLAHRVERAGADIAVDDADAAERERPEAGLGGVSLPPSAGDRAAVGGGNALRHGSGLDCCSAKIVGRGL